MHAAPIRLDRDKKAMKAYGAASDNSPLSKLL